LPLVEAAIVFPFNDVSRGRSKASGRVWNAQQRQACPICNERLAYEGFDGETI